MCTYIHIYIYIISIYLCACVYACVSISISHVLHEDFGTNETHPQPRRLCSCRNCSDGHCRCHRLDRLQRASHVYGLGHSHLSDDAGETRSFSIFCESKSRYWRGGFLHSRWACNCGFGEGWKTRLWQVWVFPPAPVWHCPLKRPGPTDRDVGSPPYMVLQCFTPANGVLHFTSLRDSQSHQLIFPRPL